MLEPASEYDAIPQPTHVALFVAPVWVEYWPAGQERHCVETDAAVALEYEPAAQMLQVDELT